MKAIVKIKQEIEIKTILIKISPRYIGNSEDDDVPSDFPLLNANKTAWVAKIDIDTGKIHDWPQGEVREMFCKVCDAGIYSLFDEKGCQLAEISGYVPNGIVPGEYGDYVDLKINADGVITNWPKHPDISAFFGDDED